MAGIDLRTVVSLVLTYFPLRDSRARFKEKVILTLIQPGAHKLALEQLDLARRILGDGRHLDALAQRLVVAGHGDCNSNCPIELKEKTNKMMEREENSFETKEKCFKPGAKEGKKKD